MNLLTHTLTVIGLLALGSGCAAAHKSAPSMQDDYYAEMAMPGGEAMDDAYGGEAMPMAESAGAAPMAGVAPAGAAPATGSAPMPDAMPSGVLGMVPAKAGGTKGERAIGQDDSELDTIGGDSVDRMIIFTGAMGLLVEPASAPSAMDAAIDLAVAAGGYVARQTDTEVQLRVPSKRFRSVMRGVGRLGEVSSRSVHTTDVTEEFHDLGVRLENLQVTRKRIQKLLDEAKGLDEILRVEQELRRVSAEIDQLEGRIRFLGSHSAFSTVTVQVTERAPEIVMVEESREIEPPPPPPPPPARVLETDVEWMDSVGVHHLMRLD